MSESAKRREECLEKITSCVMSDRNSTYGDPEDNFQDIADIWNVVFAPKLSVDHAFTAADVAVAMSAVKLARYKTSPEHLDNLVDLGGYAVCGYACVQKNAPSMPYSAELDPQYGGETEPVGVAQSGTVTTPCYPVEYPSFRPARPTRPDSAELDPQYGGETESADDVGSCGFQVGDLVQFSSGLGSTQGRLRSVNTRAAGTCWWNVDAGAYLPTQVVDERDFTFVGRPRVKLWPRGYI